MLQVPAFLSYLFDAWLLSSWMHLDMMDQSPDKNIRNVIQIITSPTMMPSSKVPTVIRFSSQDTSPVHFVTSVWV